MTYKRLSDSERQRVFQQYTAGQTIKALAAEFGVSENTIRRVIKQMEEEAAAPEAPLLAMATTDDMPEEEDLEDVETAEAVVLDEDDYSDAEDDDLEDDDDEELEGDIPLPDLADVEVVQSVEVIPLAEAVLPRPCYVVVDRRAELLTRPLEAFRGLGALSSEEAQQSTLPIFDSRPVALRYSQQNQRLYKASDVQWRKTVVKVPDGEMLRKVRSYLQSKGITRLLYHGRVYALD
ncbi:MULTISPECIES: helix-turn-helix domain-containing protein [unclassified Thermosynechococcus]|uniref:helix-turn-helix domain-containing protein n=1 Tax=unclassified Thermosynechococcus TaxID=2622553 RepID=UPI00122DE553|nr:MULTISPECIES: helix-turn-helix domain-containing protein [unclassified Thermosynechococcus]QEP99918.1 helix-turn-helix domain-containing protein [Thermosynechococcus sp. CL-1]WJI24107.1 helix-turn-helix domain-containing protein [Thermosynechococcus sp. B0]WNC32530.1 helix-turn-helix domain-containing protein [Thermosynechococcus sp. PKX95]WNC35060.1 helix-turn-helix domain-containing protein [Thermosynechococcus sp. PKX91]WNC37576.1 helix-turn-helix domain-containing protein [Thermosynecho